MSAYTPGVSADTKSMDMAILRNLMPVVAAMAIVVAAAGCKNDDSVEIKYGVYASGDLLDLTTQEVTVTSTDHSLEVYNLSAGDFGSSSVWNVIAGKEWMRFWGTSCHIDKFGVESTIKVVYKMKPGLDFSKMEGVKILAHGFAGVVNTSNKDGDWHDALILTDNDAEMFTLPDDAGALQTYLIDLGATPDVANVVVDVSGKPSVTY